MSIPEPEQASLVLADPTAPTDPTLETAAPAADPAPVVAPAAEAEAEADAEADEPELSIEEWQQEASKARKQAARYRTQLRTAQEALVAAEAALAATPAAVSNDDPAAHAESRAVAAERRAELAEASADAGIPAGLMKAVAALQAARDRAGIDAALIAVKAHLAPASVGAPRPPTETTTAPPAPTLAQQIADAERAGDARLAIRLKSQQLHRAA